MKFKLMNGQWITGQMLSKLSTVYVDSINQGSVPNIESAWTYICLTENQKILDKTIEEFNRNIEDLRGDLPIPIDDLWTWFDELFNYSVETLK